MAIKFNGIDVLSAKNDGTSLTQINRDGSPVWYALQSVSISGTALTSQTWTATVSPSAVQSMCSFQWYRTSTSGGTGSTISGATNRTYTTTTSDRGYYLYCRASIGSASVKSNVSSLIKQTITAVSISGTQAVGSVLTANATPSTATGTYVWYRDGAVISGATSKTYTLVDADRTKKIKVKITGSANYTGSSASSETGKIYGWVSRTGTLFNMTGASTPSPFHVLSGNFRMFKKNGSEVDMDPFTNEPSGNMTYTSVIYLAESYKINTVGLTFLNMYNAYTRPADAKITISGSTDNTNWTSLTSNQALSTTSHSQETGQFPATKFVNITEGTYRYLRIVTTVTNASLSTRWRGVLQVTKWKEYTNE